MKLIVRIVTLTTAQNAAAIAVFAAAFATTHDRVWLTRAEDLHRYIDSWMLADDGTWFAPQEDAIDRRFVKKYAPRASQASRSPERAEDVE